MKKMMRWAMLTILAAGSAASLQAQAVQEVMNKMIAAMGGRPAMEAVKDSTYTGTAEMVQFGMNGTITLYQKEPNLFRMDIEMMGMVITQAYDGETGWWVNPQTGAQEAMNEQQTADLKRQAMGNEALYNPAKFGITYELKPKEKIDEKEYLVLDQVFSDGFRATMYIDPATYLTFKTRAKTTTQAGTEAISESFTSDYQPEQGLMVPKSINVVVDGQDFVRLKISKCTFNTGLEDTFFKRSSK
jgi:outer membrane lipoprotein-sorting protein